MPGLLLDNMELPVQAAPPEPKIPEYGFAVSHEKVDLDIDFATQSLTGRVEITILPQTRDLRTIKIDARQCSIATGSVRVNGFVADFEYEDPLKALDIPSYLEWGAEQYEQQRDRLKNVIGDQRANGKLVINIPRIVRVEDIDPFSDNAATRALANGNVPISATPTPKTAAEQTGRFQPLEVTIDFSTKYFRDGLHFVGLNENDARFPYVYSRHSTEPGTASSIFPCIDDPAMRCTWDITIKCSRMLGDALKRKPREKTGRYINSQLNGVKYAAKSAKAVEEYEIPLSEDEKLMEMVVICSGEMMNETVDREDSSKKVISFQCGTVVAPHHIGFSIGPFEQVDLAAEFREDEDGEKLGQEQALAISGYCLPGRSNEVRNTCAPVVQALDWFSLQYGAFPFSQYSLVFVDDQPRDTEHVASISLCSTRLLVSEEFIDPEVESVRAIIQALATQWFGVGIVPADKCDSWITVGLSHFMAGLFMKMLCGKNDYLFRQKILSDQLVELDLDRPSLYTLGETLHLGDFEYEFMALKAPLVLFILDQRILKASGGGTAGLTRVISKLVIGANTGGAVDSVLETQSFRRAVDKITKYRGLEAFWNQWVLGAGCPRFNITQKFNKKRAFVEMTITQKQETLPTQRKLKKDNFMRELKEEIHGIYAGGVQPVFTGPMTIRIHEADGTPYEHIVEILDGIAKIEIPYNTKYKRLKRNRHQKERMNAKADFQGGNDALYYCLGDVLQTPQEVLEWGLWDWDEERQKEMDAEHYEWIRVDADFEWLCEKSINLPAYMYVSQLQQDQSVVAQQDSLLFLKTYPSHPLVATFLIRTLMDTRYYHGIRVLAAELLKNHGGSDNWIGMKHLQKAFEELSCYPGTKMPRYNDFEDKQSYWVECSIPRALSQIRGPNGKCPKEARQSILDMLRFNDNAQNDFSDYHKIANLLSCLADSLIPPRDSDAQNELNFGDDEDDDGEAAQFKKQVLEELERHRRMDEWLQSYHNILTTTVLDCKRKLMKAKVIPVAPLDFAQYLHDGSLDLVRIKAFEALVDLGFLANNSVASLLLNASSTDLSPYVRDHLWEVFNLGLATIAFGEDKPAEPAPPVTNGDGGMHIDGEPDGLIVQDASTELRKAHIARTTSIEGALAALKEELKDNESLQKALWKAINSTVIGVSEQRDLLDICGVLYDAVESMIVKLRMPHYWRVENHSKASLLVFKETPKIRTKPRIILNAKTPKPVVLAAPPAHPPLRLSFTASGARPSNMPVKPTMPPPKRPAPERMPNSEGYPAKKIKSGPVEGTPKLKTAEGTSKLGTPKLKTAEGISKLGTPRLKKIVKFKVSPQRLAAILRRPPVPKPCSSARTSPAPRPSPAPSPAPSSTIAVSPVPSNSSGKAPAKVRHPLPDSTAASRKPLPASASASASGSRKPLPDTASASGGRNPLPDTASGSRKPLPDTASASGGRKPLPDSLSKASSTPPPVARAPSAPLKLKLNFKKHSAPPS
ncbi:Transcription initiation factor TFIID subunit [Lachnellula occidentalis]|uniref:Transcription initiation factor TFIID subunit 2 n=1 Tax=Lachnellula occidentalis TaxID=215460 RepID=A0A8H8S903_9HELO|nr:Transcription initiation factor TFIID subunit [Lachnellula occidentalis]